MKKVLNKGILVSIIMLLFLTTSNVFADNPEQSKDIDFKKIKNEIEKIQRNINQHNSNNWKQNLNNWKETTVNTFGNRFTQDNTVIISGMFNNIESDEVCDYGFFIGSDKDKLTHKISLKEEKKHSGFMDSEIKDFEKGKTYYYQAYIEYEDEITKGVILEFCLEKQEEYEVVTVNALKGYDKNSILFIGKCENIKLMRSSKYGFYWGYNKEEISRKSYYDNQKDDYFIQSIKDVHEGTIYYQAFVEHNGVIVKGELKSFEFKKNLNN